jgi:hypothetical protein
LFLASRSKIHWSSGLLTIENRVLGLVQLSGLSLVPNPPARIKAFSWRQPLCFQGLILSARFNINSYGETRLPISVGTCGAVVRFFVYTPYLKYK